MSSTRHAKPGSEIAPERHLSDPRVAGINISLAIVTKIAAVRPEKERRAMIWLTNFTANYQRIAKVWRDRGLTPPILDVIGSVTADALAGLLDAPMAVIRECLTNPSCDRHAFVEKVNELRARFEAAIPIIADTRTTEIVKEACRYAQQKRRWALVEGKWRAGKTSAGEGWWLRNLDRCVWIDTPKDAPERSLFMRMAEALGIGISSAKKSIMYREQILNCLAIGLIDHLIFDEAHFLFPPDPSSKPGRLEWVREIRDVKGIAITLLSTAQFSEAMQRALAFNPVWAPGQLVGRIATYDLPDALTREEIIAVAKAHAPELTYKACLALAVFAEANEGYLGAMVEAIEIARDKAADGVIQGGQIADAIEQQKKLTRMRPSAPAPGRRGVRPRKVVSLPEAA
jgi:hypothetical protein